MAANPDPADLVAQLREHAAWAVLDSRAPLAQMLTDAADALEQARAELEALDKIIGSPYENHAGLPLAERATLRMVQVRADQDRCEQWRTEAEQARAERDRQALDFAAKLAFIRGTDTTDTIEAARVVLIQRAETADSRLQQMREALVGEAREMVTRLKDGTKVRSSMTSIEYAHERFEVETIHKTLNVVLAELAALAETKG